MVAYLGLIYLAAVAVPLALIDIREHRLPNRLVLPSFVVTLIGQLLSLLLGAEVLQLVHALAISALVFALGLVMNRWAGLGMGDVKLLAAIALALGWYGGALVFGAIMWAFIFAGVLVMLTKIVRRKTVSQAIALGPYLLAGFGASVVVLLQG